MLTSKRCRLFWLKQIVRSLSTTRRRFVWRLSMTKFEMKTCLLLKNKSFVIIALSYIFRSFFVELTIKFFTSFKILFLTNDDELFENVFAIYQKKRDIRIEFFIVDNFQINECVERFNQIFIREINTFLKIFELFIKWSFELINFVNYIRNVFIFIFVIDDVDKSILFYQKFIDDVYFIEKFRCID